MGVVQHIKGIEYHVLFDVRSEHWTGMYACTAPQLEPVGDEAQFKVFMDRVLKPVDLGVPA